jgi:hypothetical protein
VWVSTVFRSSVPREKLDWNTGTAHTSTGSHSGQAVVHREQREQVEGNNRENSEIRERHSRIPLKRMNGGTH